MYIRSMHGVCSFGIIATFFEHPTTVCHQTTALSLLRRVGSTTSFWCSTWRCSR